MAWSDWPRPSWFYDKSTLLCKRSGPHISGTVAALMWIDSPGVAALSTMMPVPRTSSPVSPGSVIWHRRNLVGYVNRHTTQRTGPCWWSCSFGWHQYERREIADQLRLVDLILTRRDPSHFYLFAVSGRSNRNPGEMQRGEKLKKSWQWQPVRTPGVKERARSP